MKHPGILTNTKAAQKITNRMNLLTILPLGIVCFFNTTTACCQHSISGTIAHKNEFLKEVTIQLFKKDSILVKSQLTNKNGYFKLSNVEKDNYTMLISSVGFATYTKNIFPGSDIELGVIELVPAAETLQAVLVNGEKPRFEFDKSKLIFNIDEVLRKSSINAINLIKKAPGIEVDNDRLTLNGLTGILVMLNGKKVFSDSKEALQYLNSLSTDNLKAIEINSYTSSKYDKSVNGIVNIILKKDDSQGLNGTVQSYANTGRYANYGGSVNLNYNKKNLNAYATIRSDHENNYSKGSSRTFITEPVVNSYTEAFSTLSKPHDSYIRLGLDYSINSRSSVSAIASLDYKTQEKLSNYDQGYYDQTNKIDSSIQLYDNTKVDYKRMFLNVNYNALLDSASNQSLNIDLSIVSDKPLTHSVFTHSYLNNDGEMLRPEYVLSSIIPNYVSIYGVTIDYSRKIKKDIEFVSGIKLVRSETDNNVRYDSLLGSVYKTNFQLSSYTRYVEDLYAAYIDFSKFNDKWGLQAGLRYELAEVDGNTAGNGSGVSRSFPGFYPNLLAMYNLNKAHKIIMIAKRVVARPNFDQLNPFIKYVSPTFYVQGNQFLQQFNTYIFSLNYAYKNTYTATLRYDYADNYIPQTLLIKEDQSNVTRSTYANAANLSGFQFMLNIPIAINDIWRIENYINSFYAVSTSNNNNYQGLDFRNANLSYQISQSFELPKKYYTQLTFGYITATRINQKTTKPIYTLDFNITKSFFKERVQCSFDLSDILYTNRSKGSNVYNKTVAKFYQLEDTRRIGITFSYDFGSRKIKSHRQRSIGVDNEINRINK